MREEEKRALKAIDKHNSALQQNTSQNTGPAKPILYNGAVKTGQWGLWSALLHEITDIVRSVMNILKDK